MAELDQHFRTYDTSFYYNDVEHEIQYHYERAGKVITLSGALFNGVEIFHGMKQDTIDAVVEEIKTAIDAENETPDSDSCDCESGLEKSGHMGAGL